MIKKSLIGKVARLFGNSSRPKSRYFGLNELDRKLESWIDFDGGIFVEAGANNGTSQSNTCYFERFRGWTGLLVEPIPEKAAECRDNRPNSIVENCALGPPEQENAEITMTYCDLMTTTAGSMENDETRKAHIATGCTLQNIEPYDFTVRCHTLSNLIERNSLERIDMLSLDIEGYELPALAGLDLTRHRPDLIVIESRDENAIRRHLSPHYDQVAKLSHHDLLFKAR